MGREIAPKDVAVGMHIYDSGTGIRGKVKRIIPNLDEDLLDVTLQTPDGSRGISFRATPGEGMPGRKIIAD